MEETANMKPKHYHQHTYDTAEAQLRPGYNCFKRLTEDGMGEYEAFERSVWVTYANKHLLRLGLKDDPMIELAKAENYLHRARTGKWLND